MSQAIVSLQEGCAFGSIFKGTFQEICLSPLSSVSRTMGVSLISAQIRCHVKASACTAHPVSKPTNVFNLANPFLEPGNISSLSPACSWLEKEIYFTAVDRSSVWCWMFAGILDSHRRDCVKGMSNKRSLLLILCLITRCPAVPRDFLPPTTPPAFFQLAELWPFTFIGRFF